MAGSTTNIGLIKPTYSEDADVAIINENMDTLDSTISALDNGLAIVSNNNTHGAITAGQYVYVRNHGSLAEGMYTANSNIAANATLSSSNLTAVSSGSLNKLNSDISTLNGNFACGTVSNVASLDALKTLLSTIVSGMPITTHKNIIFNLTAVFDPFTTGGLWLASIFKYTNSYFSALVHSYENNGLKLIKNKNGTWAIEEYALNSKLTTSSFISINTNLGYIKNDYMVTFYVMNASPTTTETSVGLLPSEIAPKTEFRYGGICGAYGAKNMQIKIKSNGDVTVQADSSQVSGYGACTYII